MKTFIILLTAVILSSSLTTAQVTEQWVKSYNHSGLSQDIAFGIAADATGNVYVTGSIVNGTQLTDYATIKYNSSGSQEWIRIYNSPGDYLDYGRDIATDSHGNIIVTGNGSYATTIKYDPTGNVIWTREYIYGQGFNVLTDQFDNVYVAGRWGDNSSSDYLVIKYDSAGTELWSKKYQGPANGPDFANGLHVDQSGNVYLTGAVYTGPLYAIATVKYNSSGVLQWDKSYLSPGNYSEGKLIQTDNSGNVFVTGYSDSSVTGRDFITIKYNSSGAQQWVRRYNDGYDEAVSVRVFDDNSIYVCGPSYTATRADDFILIKYNSAGDVVWQKNYDRNNGTDRPNKMVLDRHGNIYITGFSNTSVWEDAATVKFDPSGTIVWSKIYSREGSNPDTGLDIALDTTGNVYVAGRSYTSSTAEDFMTIKYSQTTGISQTSSEAPAGYFLSQNYPNPFNPSTKISFGLNKSETVSIRIYDGLGREVSTLLNTNLSPGIYDLQFNAEDLAAGVFFCRMTAGNYSFTRSMLLIK